MNDMSKGDVLLAASKIAIDGVVCSPSPRYRTGTAPRETNANILKMS